MVLRSQQGTVTAELVIALPAVLLVLTFAFQALALQVNRIELVSQVAAFARQASRGESVSGSQIEGKLICVSKQVSSVWPLKEKQCARRLGL